MSLNARIKRLERAVRKWDRQSAPLDNYEQVQAFHDDSEAWMEAYIQWAVNGVGKEPGAVPMHPNSDKWSPEEMRSSNIQYACIIARGRGLIAMDRYLKGMDQEVRREADEFCQSMMAAQELIDESRAVPQRETTA